MNISQPHGTQGAHENKCPQHGGLKRSSKTDENGKTATHKSAHKYQPKTQTGETNKQKGEKGSVAASRPVTSVTRTGRGATFGRSLDKTRDDKRHYILTESNSSHLLNSVSVTN